MINKTSQPVLTLSESVKKTGAPLSLIVRAGNLLFCSGMPPLDPVTGKLVCGDIATQTSAVLRALKHAVECSGSSLDQVVKTTVFVTNIAYFQKVNEIYASYFDDPYPARSMVAVGSWPMEFDIEIECIALAS